MRELADGTLVDDRGYTVKDAVEDWLTYGLVRKDEETQKKRVTSPRSTSSRGSARASSAI